MPWGIQTLHALEALEAVEGRGEERYDCRSAALRAAEASRGVPRVAAACQVREPSEACKGL